jgi:hypothetical protein
VGAQSPSESDKLRGFGGSAPKPLLLGCQHEKRHPQLTHRLAVPLIRHVLESFRTRQIGVTEATQRLELSRSRFYELFSGYLAAYGPGQHRQWTPRASGGNHATTWPKEVVALLGKRLRSKPPASYSFAASEALRLCHFQLHRSQVRRWALGNGCAHAEPVPRPRTPVRRWQRARVGELWQLDASPHRWFPTVAKAFPMLNMLDDCSRLFVGSKLYEQELLLAYFDFLPEAFLRYGLPLEIYVDYHSFFFSTVPESLTQLGEALRFYGVSFRYAPTPQAKGKVEREHPFWQNRLPAYFASEAIAEWVVANEHVDALREHRNRQETHRELGMTAQEAWDRAERQRRSVMRAVPRCPWWPYVWSMRRWVKVAADGRVAIGGQWVRVEAACDCRVVLCQHPSGQFSVLAAAPDPKSKPVVLFTNRPK